MNVSLLQRHLNDLAGFLEEGGGSKTVIADIKEICDKLTRFRDLPLKGFADFLVRCDQYSRGEVPVVAGKTPRVPKVKEPQPSIEELSQQVKVMVEKANDINFEMSQADALVETIKKLSKDGVAKVASAINLTFPKAATKDKIAQAIQHHFGEIKRVAQRVHVSN